jgi:hypothetical protein
MEEDGISPLLWVFLAGFMAYMTATPGPLQGAIDYYISAPFLRLTQPSLQPNDVQVGRKLAQGGFGTVYLGTSLASIPGKIRKGQVSP